MHAATEHLAVRLLWQRASAEPAGPPWLVCADTCYRAGEVLDRVWLLMWRLQAEGVPVGAPVLLEAERGVELIVSLLAIWAHGAVPAPIDLAHPQPHRNRAAAAVGAAWVLTATAGGIALAKTDRPACSVPDGTSHILFTSGTSGPPAGVAVSEAPLAAMLAWYRETIRPTPADRFALLGGVGHDPLLRDILVSLAAGQALVVPGPEVLAVPGALGDFLLSNRVTIAHVTPALLEFGLAGGPAELPQLRAVLSGGALLPRTLALALFECCPALALYNVYGATETPQVVSCHRVEPADLAEDADHVVPIGTGVAGARVALAGELDLDGDPDEIVVQSPNLALGYVAATRTAGFVDTPPIPGGRLYRTGDIGRRNGRGRLTVTGRRDRQVSVNGYRLALEEVEAAAARHPDVAHARAEARTGPFGTTLALTVVGRPGREPSVTVLRKYLRSELPGYAVPSAIVVAEAALDANHKALIGPGRAAESA
jgi:non-ribosomal peptide synthetase component F